METHVNGSRVPVFSLGERIRKAREDMGLSQQAFADALGVDRKTVSNWEGGRNRPRYGDLMLVASVTDVSLQWLAADEFRSHLGVVAGTVAVEGIDNREGARRDTDRFDDSMAELAAA